MTSTICAVSTAIGTGAISIIRCSGPEAIKIVASIFRGPNLTKVKTHTLHYGYIMNQEEVLDEVLVSVMKAPKTFTTEDVVEINSHGGIATTNSVLNLLLENGCELAEPGEFTKRAFLGGRIDLLSAEAVGDLIVSETEKARKMAINQLSGGLSQKISTIRSLIIDAQVNIEVNIDYPEYHDIEVITEEMLNPKLQRIIDELTHLFASAENGSLIKNGINVAIIGQPNVGKSSILNALLNESKAIVTNIPGTTRDVVEGKIVLDGIILNVIDTAGIRQTEDVVEQLGVQKSLELSQTADLIIYVVDNSAALAPSLELLKKLSSKKLIIFVNKDDIVSNNDYKVFQGYPLVKGNTLTVNGLENLKDKIKELFNLNYLETKDYSYLSNARQVSLVKQALDILGNAMDSLSGGLPIDIITIDLKTAYALLGEIIGETYKEDLLDELFSRFCLGK